MRSVLRWTARLFGVVILAVVGTGLYIWSQMPKPLGKPPVLQAVLFEKPKVVLPVEGKFIFKSAAELAALIRAKKATSVEVTQELIHYIKNNNYKTKAFVWLFEAEALAAAKAADEKVARGELLGLLHGVPVCIKEEFFVKGKPCTWNSESFQGFVAPRNAAAVDAWLSEGAIILGTTNVPRMLIDLQTDGDIYPSASNPYDTLRTPGGSSGGGAAAVASGFCPLGLGGDMGGSIRVPSVFCGIYGLKTTGGSMGKQFGSSPDTSGDGRYFAMAVAGPMARTVEDIELGWKALIHPWYKDHEWLKVEEGKKLSDYKVAYFDEWHFGKDKISIAAAVKQKLQCLVDSLTRNGVSVKNTQPDNFVEMRQMHMLLMAYMVFAKQPWIIRQLIKNDFESATPLKVDLSEGVARIGDVNEAEYVNILSRKERLTAALEKFFQTYDFLILPVTPNPAFVKNPTHQPMEVDGVKMEYWDHFHYPMCFNATGHPSLAIPLGLDKKGLPIGVQVVGPLYSEMRLIHFAKLIQGLHVQSVAPRI